MSSPVPRGGRPPGQATVELALCLPVVVLLGLLLVQIGLVVRAQVLVVQAARAGARAAAVEPNGAVATAAARDAVPDGAGSLHVALSLGTGQPPVVRVDVREHVVTDVPIVGSLLGEVTVEAVAVMAVERPDR